MHKLNGGDTEPSIDPCGEVIQRQQSGPAEQGLCSVRAPDDLAQGLGQKLGRGEVLLSAVPRRV